ncbi:MAG TPA: ORF6N domain-containing protein [bacterium]|nr:ORF6N domain-containing protein [bacterium]
MTKKSLNLLMRPTDLGSRIHVVRSVQVILDSDLAELYEVETKQINRAVKRNAERFPAEFMFQLTEAEVESLRFQFGTSNANRGGRRYLPYAFTEQGVAMLSAVLRSETAVRVSVQIMRVFVEMRRFLQNNAQMFSRLDSVERRQITFESETAQNFEKVFDALGQQAEPPKQGIFYDGQIYDAYTFVADLIRRARKSLVLIDNYVDDTVLTLLAKRKDGVSATIYTKNISQGIALDLKKHNEQYPPITIVEFKEAHDRFLIVDEKETYHLGASLKDLGKKWFAFSKLECGTMEILSKLKVI